MPKNINKILCSHIFHSEMRKKPRIYPIIQCTKDTQQLTHSLLNESPGLCINTIYGYVLKIEWSSLYTILKHM